MTGQVFETQRGEAWAVESAFSDRDDGRQALNDRSSPMTKIRTDSNLLKRLEEATEKPLSRDELRNQRVSFVMGSLKKDSTITRDQVEKVLQEQEGSGGSR